MRRTKVYTISTIVTSASDGANPASVTGYVVMYDIFILQKRKIAVVHDPGKRRVPARSRELSCLAPLSSSLPICESAKEKTRMYYVKKAFACEKKWNRRSLLKWKPATNFQLWKYIIP